MEFNLSGVSSGKTNGKGKVEDVIVLGAGPAGMAAALYAARAELHPLVITGIQIGGQAAITHIVENYPGYPEGIGGQELSDLFQKQAERFGARFEFDSVTAVDFTAQPFKVVTYGGEYFAKTVIVATGATANKLKVAGEKELTGKGVSYCGTCDGWFFKDKPVVIIGGGDSALEEGIFLTRYVSSVDVIHRRDELRAGAILQRRASENEKIKYTWDSVVTEILGDDAVDSVKLKNVKTGEETIFPTEGVFIFIGHTPNTDFLKGQIELDENGYVKTNHLMETNIPGVFAGGEVADPHFRQVITSAGMGAAAAIQATRYLEENE